MPYKADEAAVVTSEEDSGSKTMDAALTTKAICNSLWARQAVLPGNATPQLDTTTIPLI